MIRPNWPPLVLASALLLLTACGDKDDTASDDTASDDTASDDTASDDTASDDTGEPPLDACVLAEEWSVCAECYSGEVTCEYGQTRVTEGSCEDCQARGALYAALCSAGVEDSRAEIEAGTTCSDPV